MAPKKPKAAPEPKPERQLPTATLIHFTYQADAGIVRANIQQDVKVGTEKQRVGRDADLAFSDLPAAVRNAITKAYDAVAGEVEADTLVLDTEG